MRISKIMPIGKDGYHLSGPGSSGTFIGTQVLENLSVSCDKLPIKSGTICIYRLHYMVDFSASETLFYRMLLNP